MEDAYELKKWDFTYNIKPGIFTKLKSQAYVKYLK
jgi:hypothetical protein